MTEQRIYKPAKVTRSNAGGTLWAPIDQHGIEHGATPSHDRKVIEVLCKTLNRSNVGESRNDSHGS